MTQFIEASDALARANMHVGGELHQTLVSMFGHDKADELVEEMRVVLSEVFIALGDRPLSEHTIIVLLKAIAHVIYDGIKAGAR